MLELVPGRVSLSDLESIYRNAAPYRFSDLAYTAIATGCSTLADRIDAGDVIYGVNTGFGKLASVRIPPDKLALLQRNLVYSHAAGTGPVLPERIVRLMIALKGISLGRGASGVRPILVETLSRLAEADILPVIPSQGSVGASGDLAPLAHLAAPLIGEGDVVYRGTRMPAAQALQRAGIEPIELQAKEGLALLNGTQASTALALAGLFDAWHLAIASLTTTALSVDAAMGSSAPFHDEIHQLRGHRGQIDSARRLRELLAGSEIRRSHVTGDERVQDPYCLRCAPQVIGACIDQIKYAARTLETEANAATDNPLVLSDGEIVSGGNFHAEPVALAADQIAIAISEIGAISQRRIAMLVDPALNFGLPAFLAPNPGLTSGLMIAEVTSAALMSENKSLSNPRSVDSTPTSANQEDHVSMACHAARRLTEMTENLGGILAIETMCAVQGIELRAPLATSAALSRVIGRVRDQISPYRDDRIISSDIATMKSLVQTGALLCEAQAETTRMELGS
ncbi:histidine ammonia-lyase [Hyphomonas sp.]|uniref:histidine ammonia-lyase n=1 Tax=Hyphomonas sp. TaxID=87 RepID=UPI0025C1CCFF|nr:histidine ammonia-lyase [Hyphomonas sp.]